MKFECPVCHASLRHERIDDGIIVHTISATGEVEELVNKSDGGNRVYCSANEKHDIPHELADKVIELCSCR
jgi:hypothetical protein